MCIRDRVCDSRYIVRELLKIEQADVMSMRRAIERNSCAAGPGAQNSDLHLMSPGVDDTCIECAS